jgi:hypothetical protein
MSTTEFIPDAKAQPDRRALPHEEDGHGCPVPSRYRCDIAFDSQTVDPRGTALRAIPAHSRCAARGEAQTVPWWLWWNILSIDAPTVAAVWALLFARANGVRLGGSEVIDLSLIVWLIYTGDRIFDGWRATNLTPLQERHRFCARHRVPLAFLGILATAAILWLTSAYMPPAETKAGLQLGAIVGAYIAGIHLARGRVAQVAPKEIAVGALFAAGTTLPVWSQNAALPWNVWMSVILFALLCAVNCLSIESWENHRSNDAWLGTPQPLVRWVNSRIDVIAAALAISALIVVLASQTKTRSSSGLWAVSLSALLIVLLNRGRHRLSRSGLRVLADAALVLPGLLALMIRM